MDKDKYYIKTKTQMIKNFFYFFYAKAYKKVFMLLLVHIAFLYSFAQVFGGHNIYVSSEEKLLSVFVIPHNSSIENADIIYVSENTQIEGTESISQITKIENNQKPTLAGIKQETSANKKHKKQFSKLSSGTQKKYRQTLDTSVFYANDSKNTNEKYLARNIATVFVASAGGFLGLKFLKSSISYKVCFIRKANRNLISSLLDIITWLYKKAHSVRPPPFV